MNFFEQQDAARRQTTRLVVLFLLAVLAIVVAVNFVAALAFLGLPTFVATGLREFAPPRDFYLYLTLATLALIASGSLFEMLRLSAGGPELALMMGARPIARASANPDERRLQNVVEEMAIASGVAMPRVFVMDEQTGINAFAAGLSPNKAAIVVTRGTLEKLNRDELQGVIGHEFSHILNGDMRLNLRLMGVLAGILLLTTLGRMLARASSGRDSRGAPALLIGLGLIVVGYIGVFFGRLIQAAVSRQREFLADASSVQYTRNPDGIGGALAKIAANGSRVSHPRAEQVSHMFFGEGVGSSIEELFPALMATHPPVAQRLERVYGRPVAIEEIIAHAAPVAPAADAQSAERAVPDANAFGRSAGERRKANFGAQASMHLGSEAVIAAMGAMNTGHIDFAATLLRNLPDEIAELTRNAEGARLVMVGLVLALDGPVMQAQSELLRRGGIDPGQALAVAARVQGLGKIARLPLIALATPALQEWSPEQRKDFLESLQQLIQADRRVTLEEFIVATLLDAALRERSRRAPLPAYRKLEALAADARLALSLVAHATRGDAAASFAQGVKELGIPLQLIAAQDLKLAQMQAALARLNRLVPMQKPRLVKALVQCALAESTLSLMDAELLRAICASLDSPLPPFLEAMPYSE